MLHSGFRSVYPFFNCWGKSIMKKCMQLKFSEETSDPALFIGSLQLIVIGRK